MKIINENAAYIQKKDIEFLLLTDIKIPESIYLRILEMEIDDTNKYEFVKFTNSDEIKYIKNIDWIADYDKIKNLTEDDMINLCKDIVEKTNKLAEKFNALPEKKKKKRKKLLLEYQLLDYKMHTIRDALWFKQGHIKMTLPRTSNYNLFYKRRS